MYFWRPHWPSALGSCLLRLMVALALVMSHRQILVSIEVVSNELVLIVCTPISTRLYVN